MAAGEIPLSRGGLPLGTGVREADPLESYLSLISVESLHVLLQL